MSDPLHELLALAEKAIAATAEEEPLDAATLSHEGRKDKALVGRWSRAATAAETAADTLNAAASPSVLVPLLRELVERRKDGVRLDWLEIEASLEPLLLHDGRGDCRGHRGLGLRPGLLNRTLREAIDSARPVSATPTSEAPAP